MISFEIKRLESGIFMLTKQDSEIDELAQSTTEKLAITKKQMPEQQKIAVSASPAAEIIFKFPRSITTKEQCLEYLRINLQELAGKKDEESQEQAKEFQSAIIYFSREKPVSSAPKPSEPILSAAAAAAIPQGPFIAQSGGTPPRDKPSVKAPAPMAAAAAAETDYAAGDEADTEKKQNPRKPKTLRYKARLLIGEGDLGFTEALINKHATTHPGLSAAITATELKSESDLERGYKDTFPQNRDFLIAQGVNLQFGVNAMTIGEEFKGQRFKRIQFNFPHDRSNWKTSDSLPGMLAKFFQSGRSLQNLGDRIHVTIPEKDEFYRAYVYDLYDAAIKAGYSVLKKRKFWEGEAKRYPKYEHRQTIGTHGGVTPVEAIKHSREWIFEQCASPEEAETKTKAKYRKRERTTYIKDHRNEPDYTVGKFHYNMLMEVYVAKPIKPEDAVDEYTVGVFVRNKELFGKLSDGHEFSVQSIRSKFGSDKKDFPRFLRAVVQYAFEKGFIHGGRCVLRHDLPDISTDDDSSDYVDNSSGDEKVASDHPAVTSTHASSSSSSSSAPPPAPQSLLSPPPQPQSLTLPSAPTATTDVATILPVTTGAAGSDPLKTLPSPSIFPTPKMTAYDPGLFGSSSTNRSFSGSTVDSIILGPPSGVVNPAAAVAAPTAQSFTTN